jgi:hypothetical protein
VSGPNVRFPSEACDSATRLIDGPGDPDPAAREVIEAAGRDFY